MFLRFKQTESFSALNFREQTKSEKQSWLKVRPFFSQKVHFVPAETGWQCYEAREKHLPQLKLPDKQPDSNHDVTALP